jgi:RNA polymerase sigma-70 factor (ECF subfamily)
MPFVADLHRRTEPPALPLSVDGPGREQFALLYREWYPSVVRLCRRYLGRHADAEAMAQDVFARAWESWPRFVEGRPFWPWVSIIARRLCINELATRRRRSELLPGVPIDVGPADPADEAVNGVADREAVKQVLHSLSHRQQRVLRLRDLEGWSYEEIARFDGMTVEAVRGTLRRARASFRRLYDDVTAGLPAAWGLAFRMLHSWQRAPLGARVLGPEWAAALAVVFLVPATVVAPPPPASSGPGPMATAAAPGPTEGGSRASAPLSTAMRPRQAAVTGAEPLPEVASLPPTDGIGEARVEEYTVSPNYEQDRTVFATGWANECDSPGMCPVLYKSQDGGTTWRKLQAAGLQQGRVLLPPSYPRDSRIFSFSTTYLSVSEDHGSSFRLLTPVQGEATMSPLFSASDPRILFTSTAVYPAAPVGLQYDDRTGRLAPLPLVMPNGAAPLRFAFSPGYAADRSMLVGGGRVDVAGKIVGSVALCSEDGCKEVFATPKLSFVVELLWTGGPGATAFVYTDNTLYASVDGGNTFEQRFLPGGDGNRIRSFARASDGRYLLSVVLPDLTAQVYESHDEAVTWSLLNVASSGRHKLTPLPDGRVLGIGFPHGSECSVDGGRTWTPSCQA